MRISVSIAWHMSEAEGRASATLTNNGGALRLSESKSIGYPSLDIYLDSVIKAKIAAAAINGEWAEVRELMKHIEGE